MKNIQPKMLSSIRELREFLLLYVRWKSGQRHIGLQIALELRFRKSFSVDFLKARKRR